MSKQFLGAGNTGNGHVTIEHAATTITLESTASGDLASGATRTITATMRDDSGTVVSTGSDAVFSISVAKAGSGSVAGPTTVPAVGGVVSIVVTGGTPGTVQLTATAGDRTSTALAFTVVKAPQAVTFPAPASPAEFGTTFVVAPTSSASLQITLAATGGCSVAPNGAGWTVTVTSGTIDCVLTASQPGDTNRLAAADVSRAVDVARAAPTPLALAGDAVGVYGDSYELVSSGGSGTGGRLFEATGPCAIDTSAGARATVTITAGTGTCRVVATQEPDADYLETSAEHTIAASKRMLDVDAVAGTAVYGETDPALVASVTGFVTPLDALQLTGAATCERAPGVAVGSYAITCRPGSLSSPDYTFTDGATAQFVVTSAPLSITASSERTTYGDAPSAIVPAYGGLVSGDTAPAVPAACATGASAASSAGSYATSCSGAVDANYAISYQSGTVSVSPAPLLITASDATSIYGAPAPAITVGYLGLVNGETAPDTAPVCVAQVAPTTPAAAVAGVSTCAGAADGDYDISYASGTVTVERAPLVVTAVGAASVYGSSPAGVTAAFSGFVNGDTAASLTAAPTCTTAVTPASHVGDHSVECAGASSSNYTIDYVAGTASVTPAILRVDGIDASATVGDADPTFGWTISGFIGSDDASLVTGRADCTREPGDAVGVYAIACLPGSLAAADYSVRAGASSSFVVSLLPQSIVLDAGSVRAGDSVTVTGTGFVPLESVQVWVHSAPVLLATVTATRQGRVNATVVIPSSLPPGAHEIVLVGLDSGMTLGADLRVDAIPTSGLASTGAMAGWSLSAAALLLAAGSVLLVRRRTTGAVTGNVRLRMRE